MNSEKAVEKVGVVVAFLVAHPALRGGLIGFALGLLTYFFF